MIPSLLITFREVIEASLIVATILGILVKLHHQKAARTVWIATLSAAAVSILLLAIGSFIGIKIQDLYTGKTETLIEGSLMMISAIFITWAVFFLHNYFGRYKAQLLGEIKETVEKAEQRGIFILTFTAVLREGIEIVLFLTTVFLANDPKSIFSGFIIGAVLGLLISGVLFTATLRMPVFYAFRISSILLVAFAAGLLARGVHEFSEAHLLPELYSLSFSLIPHTSTPIGSTINSVFGVTRTMDLLQLATYSAYVCFMSWYIFFRKRTA